jgi:transcriptional regulator with XRE-family HTH domain
MKINKIISERRKSLGITQKKLSEKIGIRHATLSEFERGKHGLGSDKLEAILVELQLSIQPDTADAGGAFFIFSNTHEDN